MAENEIFKKFQKLIEDKRIEIDLRPIKKDMSDQIDKMTDSTTQVDKSTSKKEIEAIEESLKNSIRFADKFRENQHFAKEGDQVFRLDNPMNKGAGHWEIQRNGVRGKLTTVAQVKAPDSLQLLLNQIGDTKIQSNYYRIICEKLIKSLKSDQHGNKVIKKEFVRFEDLIGLFDD